MKLNRCSYRKGFTLIELMVVIFIIGILSSVAIPMMKGRIDATKWSEGKSMAGSIRTAARTYIAEMGNAYDFSGTTLAQLGFATGDLDGKYFRDQCFSITWDDLGTDVPPHYIITVDASLGQSGHPLVPTKLTLDQDGTYIEF
jgi:prepilin-type N-terminal cleavage/methylation domain-containing protein